MNKAFCHIFFLSALTYAKKVMLQESILGLPVFETFGNE